MRMVAGKRYYGEDVKDVEEAREFRELVSEIIKMFGASNPGEFVAVLRWIDYGGLEKKLKGFAKRTDVFMQGLIDETRNKDEEGEKTMINHLLSLQKSQLEYYTDQIIKRLMLVLILAGIEMLAVTLEWAMSNLINHPDMLKKARVDLDNRIGQEKLIDELDVSKLHYIQCIISKTFRLYPTAPLLVPHFSSNDCTIRGYDIPRDTILLVNAWAIHRDPELWEDTTSFKLERFEIGACNPYKLMPFGLVTRACPGAGLAQRIVSLTLGSLIQCFEWERVTNEKVDMTEGNGITMLKVVPLETMCKAHPIMHKILSMSMHDV
ncbi:(+)-piperitol/(+)-sesamin synthase CYP81Q2-like [Quercus robur]|uniref:(+)-piperitol/(+)-sesamin synthase CYP81Q2-like n=1 Tax=Quercus robur TaxID=38942 RepID=UPI002163FBAC|nr:(+)-piperitol/(+)-sesamin synthase CYP81Q2-like [Quercus robur]